MLPACLLAWRGRAWGLAHDTHTHTYLRRGILEGWSVYHRGDNFGFDGRAQRNIIKHHRMLYCACSNARVTDNIHARLSYYSVGTSKRENHTWKKSDVKLNYLSKVLLSSYVYQYCWISKAGDTKWYTKFGDQQKRLVCHGLACHPIISHPGKKRRKLPCSVPRCAPNVMPLEAVKWGATHEWLCCWERRTYRPSLSGAASA